MKLSPVALPQWAGVYGCNPHLGVEEVYSMAETTGRGFAETSGRISLVLPQAADVDIQMYAADGRRLAVLARGRFGAGVHRLTLPATAPPGVYVVNGRVGGARVSVKVLKL